MRKVMIVAEMWRTGCRVRGNRRRKGLRAFGLRIIAPCRSKPAGGALCGLATLSLGEGSRPLTSRREKEHICAAMCSHRQHPYSMCKLGHIRPPIPRLRRPEPSASCAGTFSDCRSACTRAASRRCRADVDGRSSGRDRRSFPSTGRSSRPCGRPRTAR